MSVSGDLPGILHRLFPMRYIRGTRYEVRHTMCTLLYTRGSTFTLCPRGLHVDLGGREDPRPIVEVPRRLELEHLGLEELVPRLYGYEAPENTEGLYRAYYMNSSS